MNERVRPSDVTDPGLCLGCGEAETTLVETDEYESFEVVCPSDCMNRKKNLKPKELMVVSREAQTICEWSGEIVETLQEVLQEEPIPEVFHFSGEGYSATVELLSLFGRKELRITVPLDKAIEGYDRVYNSPGKPAGLRRESRLKELL
jgi:hypothetical protein